MIADAADEEALSGSREKDFGVAIGVAGESVGGKAGVVAGFGYLQYVVGASVLEN